MKRNVSWAVALGLAACLIWGIPTASGQASPATRGSVDIYWNLNDGPGRSETEKFEVELHCTAGEAELGYQHYAGQVFPTEFVDVIPGTIRHSISVNVEVLHTYKFYVRAIDAAGRQSAWQTFEFTPDTVLGNSQIVCVPINSSN